MGLMVPAHTSTTAGTAAATRPVWLLLVERPGLVGSTADVVTEVCSGVFQVN